MVGGYGEGLVIIAPSAGPDCGVSKWKNGTEASGDNLGALHSIQTLIEENKEAFGDNREKAIEIFDKMLEVEKSKLINGA